MGYKRNRSYVLHGTPKRVSKPLALGQRRTAVVRLMSSDSSRVLVLSEIGKIVQKEIKLCSNNYHSIIREHSPTALEYFSWRTIILEVMHKAPTLYTIIDKCLMSSNESSRHLLCVVASVVLKSRNPHMCMVQAMVSILMYAGHAGKQVCLCTILQVSEKLTDSLHAALHGLQKDPHELDQQIVLPVLVVNTFLLGPSSKKLKAIRKSQLKTLSFHENVR